VIVFVVSLLAAGKGKDSALYYDVLVVFAGTNSLLITTTYTHRKLLFQEQQKIGYSFL